MKYVVVTGMSGAGKTTALKFFEDMGYYCVDNLPVPLLPKFIELTSASTAMLSRIALGIDIRNMDMLEEMQKVMQYLHEEEVSLQIVYLDASDNCLLKRYKETRRSHPLAPQGHVEEGIVLERKRTGFLREQADYVINTSQLLTRELKGQLEDIFLKGEDFNSLFITVLSFGFKYGIPTDADLVFDVRFLPNPYYNEEMRPLTGNDERVSSYVMGFDQTREFLDRLGDMIRFLIPHYISEGKTQLVIAIGCTGGKHRSVTLANALYHQLVGADGCGVRVEHRDMDKDAKRR